MNTTGKSLSLFRRAYFNAFIMASDNEKYYFGNLGQDAFTKFDEMVINFESMYVILTNSSK